MDAETGETASGPRNVLRMSDLTASEFEALLVLAGRMAAEPAPWDGSLPGRVVTCLFELPSTRSRVSFAAAAYRLGMLPITLGPDDLQIRRGETIADTARALSAYSAAIVVRTQAHERLLEFARFATAPVVNALTPDHHPCQALTDLMTIRQHVGSLRGIRLAFVGAGTNVAHSLMEAAGLTGMHLVMACPPSYGPDPAVAALAQDLARTNGGQIDLVTDPREAVAGADAVSTDVWVSMGTEAEADHRFQALAPYQVTTSLMDLANRHAIFLHCLPARRGEEVTAEVIDGPRSVVSKQVANHLPAEEAVLSWLISGQTDPPSSAG